MYKTKVSQTTLNVTKRKRKHEVFLKYNFIFLSL